MSHYYPPPTPHYPAPAQGYRAPRTQPGRAVQPQQPTRPPPPHISSSGGARKSLCIGINYKGQQDELEGCVNDAKDVDDFLRTHWGFDRSQMVLLTDDSPNPKEQPTKHNMLAAMQWLVRDAKRGDSLFIHYSGHGGQSRDLDGDEVSGYDDVIFPVDSEVNGDITDDELNATLARPLPAGCRLTALFDSCHSGSILDLDYGYDSQARPSRSYVTEKFRGLKASAGEVVCWSGSVDSGTSADTVEGGVAVGAMSYTFIQQLKQQPNISYAELLESVGGILRKQFKQQPQISTSLRMDLNRPFTI